MKILSFITLLLLSASAFSQPRAIPTFQSVESIEDAEQFMQSHPELHPRLRSFNPAQDTSAIGKRLFPLKKGEVLSAGGYTYKKLTDTTKYSFRASYIYLDGSKLSRSAIDSLRKLILRRYAAGSTFEKLADEFTMDGNQKHGDLGFFRSGMMVKEFEGAVRSHANGEIFTVDVPDNQWYYVVKKTAPNQVEREVEVLQIKNH